ncbi:MAG: hypothetical protein IT371_15730 [Deltaproteobacteria bacterium]|nr:hypothetical protein [Deltaproteobacteria bacterium]
MVRKSYKDCELELRIFRPAGSRRDVTLPLNAPAGAECGVSVLAGGPVVLIEWGEVTTATVTRVARIDANGALLHPSGIAGAIAAQRAAFDGQHFVLLAMQTQAGTGHTALVAQRLTSAGVVVDVTPFNVTPWAARAVDSYSPLIAATSSGVSAVVYKNATGQQVLRLIRAPGSTADGGPTLADGGPKPADGGPKPADGAPMPADGAPMPADGAPMPADGAPMPADGAPMPADGAPGTPEPASAVPDAAPAKTDAAPVKPDAVAVKTDAVVAKPDAVGVKTDAVVAKPDAVVAKTDAVVAKPDAVVAKTDAVVAKPDAAAPRADAGSPATDAAPHAEAAAPCPSDPVSSSGGCAVATLSSARSSLPALAVLLLLGLLSRRRGPSGRTREPPEPAPRT